ncbi:MAG: undecaprenyl-diphosphate phosphatase [Candidatus Paceibacterota bacterium]|jgi:undecaprenyl-diphosphatase|nr:undecaprenyl-diphosphate phosphatase [Bacteroidota bacterium]OFY47758.1 MAG: undecaprenyl-diphosphatase UppP [Bacteroidetes bacterium GWF2_41_31]OFZ02284.1 MAG: undecaprenyl-diphosphatase UppP [Bacteroidetes bacterium RIFOXYB12_FULL_41_6]PJB58013.1 MAG: UDP-diphosphatase [Bacteroidetes bacterium CG_4_9_14_3_um_filter_41_19]
MTWFEAFILAVVEGITEFLPVSSTGHMILAEGIMGMKSNDFIQAFIINIQFGAILSVVVLYWKRFFQTMKFYYKLFVAFLPAAVFGLLLSDYIDMLLESVYVVAVVLILGGIVLVFIDKWYNKVSDDQEITYPIALKIGLFQVIAMIPGVSRSAATIIGGMSQKLSRKAAAEFSFFLAVPTMFAASGYKLTKNYTSITTENIDILIFGNVVAFIVALIAIKSFITFLTKHGFKLFGYYRIAIGVIILVLYFVGVDLTIS